MFDTPASSFEESNETVIAVLDAPPETEVRKERRTRTEEKTRHEPNWHVIIWNDEVHTYEYVIELLINLFGHSAERAFQITREVDKAGKGIAWTCHQELAELKRDQILAYGADWRMSESEGPIRATIEPAPE